MLPYFYFLSIPISVTDTVLQSKPRFFLAARLTLSLSHTSLSCRRRSRATLSITTTVLYTNVDAHCDKLTTPSVELNPQPAHRIACACNSAVLHFSCYKLLIVNATEHANKPRALLQFVRWRHIGVALLFLMRISPTAPQLFTARRYASAVYAVIVCPSVRPSTRLSATSRYFIETTGRIELVGLFGIEASVHLSHTVL